MNFLYTESKSQKNKILFSGTDGGLEQIIFLQRWGGGGGC